MPRQARESLRKCQVSLTNWPGSEEGLEDRPSASIPRRIGQPCPGRGTWGRCGPVLQNFTNQALCYLYWTTTQNTRYARTTQPFDSKTYFTYGYISPEYLDVAELPPLGRCRRGEPQEEQGEEGISLHCSDDAVARFSGQ